MKVKLIHKTQLAKTWKKLSNKPLPKIKAIRLSDDDFNHAIRQRQCFEDDMREIKEWGRVLSTKGTDACVFRADERDEEDFVILVRENPYHSLNEIIVHELSHIARGDL